MAENPLLPDAELRALHALLKIATRLPAREQAGKPGRSTGGTLSLDRPALLAGTVLQLQAGDTLVCSAADAVPFSLLARRTDGVGGQISTMRNGTSLSSLAAGTALAAALKARKSDRLVLVLVNAGDSEPGWNDALQQAQAEQLPLVVACADPSGNQVYELETRQGQDQFTWTTLQKPAARSKLPILTVDGEDAVAVYRVMQESVLRARSGGGPAVLWAALPTSRRTAKVRATAETPLARLKHFLRSRRVSLRKPR